jgi:hypothetical protein
MNICHVKNKQVMDGTKFVWQSSRRKESSAVVAFHKAATMTSHSNFEEDDIKLKILEYLYDNQGAQDTLEGIVQWWLLERHIRQQYTLVRKALSDLVNRGLIIEIKASNTNIVYRINSNKIEEIKSIIDKVQDE